MANLEIGKVLKPQGIKGEIKVELFTTDFAFLRSLKQIYIENDPFIILSVRFENKYAYIKTAEILDRNFAEKLRNKSIFVEKDSLSYNNSSEFLISDLENCEILDENNKLIGFIESVEKYGSADIINIKKAGAIKSFPFLNAVIKEIDIKNKKIIVFKDKLDEVLV